MEINNSTNNTANIEYRAVNMNTAQGMDSSQTNDINAQVNHLAFLTNNLQLRNHLGNATPNHHQKSLEKADKYREEGNSAYVTDKNLEKALQLYTQSLLFAPPKSLSYAIAHANRSTVLKDMGHFVDSIAEIQRALKAGYIQQLVYKLYIRLGVCYKKIKENGKAVKSFKKALHYLQNTPDIDNREVMKMKVQMEIKTCGRYVVEAPLEDITQVPMIGDVHNFKVPSFKNIKKFNPEVPAVSSFVALKYNKQFGRHLVSTRDIEIGEVLLIEEPFAAVLDPKFHHTHCNHCMKLCRTLLPCNKCTWAMYCSISCIEASKRWHQHECAIMPSIDAMQCNSILSKLCGRIVFTAGSNNLIKFFDNQKNIDHSKLRTNDDEIRKDGFNENGVYLSSDVNTIGNLCYHEPSNPASKETCMFLAATIMKLFTFDTVTFSNDLIQFLVRFLVSNPYNSSEILEFHNKATTSDVVSVSLATAIYPTYALMNHSCFSNTVNQYFGKTLVVRSSRFIEKGSQIFTSMYGVSFVSEPKYLRQNELNKACFKCHCNACDEEWPVLYNLPPFPTFHEHEIKSRYESSVRKFTRSVKKFSVGRSCEITNQNIGIFKSHLMDMARLGKINHQHYVCLTLRLQKYYCMSGNHVVEEPLLEMQV